MSNKSQLVLSSRHGNEYDGACSDGYSSMYGIDRYDGLKLLVGLRQVNLKLEAAS